MGYTWFNLKELAVARVVTDAKGVTSGPTYGSRIDWEGAKKIGINLSQEQITATGNGVPIDVQTSLGKVEIAVETNVMTPEVHAAIYGEHHSEDPDKTRMVYHMDSGGKYVGVWARTDKIGTNGEDVWLWIPNAMFATNNRDSSENQHRNLTYNAAASYTKSSLSMEEINETTGVLETITKRFILVEDNNRVAASLFSPNTGALVVSTPAAPITGHVVSASIVITFPRSLKRASINKSTVLLKLALTPFTPFAFDLTLSKTTLDDDTMTINPTGSLAAATEYSVTLKEAVQDVDSNHLAADTSISVTTA